MVGNKDAELLSGHEPSEDDENNEPRHEVWKIVESNQKLKSHVHLKEFTQSDFKNVQFLVVCKLCRNIFYYYRGRTNNPLLSKAT